MKMKYIVCAAALMPAAAPAVTYFHADLGQTNSSGITGYINFTLDGSTLTVDLNASGVADGTHYLHIHGLDDAAGNAVNTIPPPPPIPPNGDADGNGVLSTPEAKTAVGNVLLSLAQHAPGTQAEFLGVSSVGGTLTYQTTFDLSQNVYEPGHSAADLLPLTYRVFDMHGGLIPATATDKSTVGTFDANLPVAAGKILAGLAPVPEPATWATMVAGFGLVGAAMRRRRPLAAAA